MYNLTQSQSKYLYAIYSIESSGTVCRPLLVKIKLGVSLPAATQMIDTLEEKGFVLQNNVIGGMVTLSPKGIVVAKSITNKVEFLTTLLQLAGMSEEVAHNEALNMCYAFSDEALNSLSCS